MRRLEDVLAAWRSDAVVLHRHGDTRLAEQIEQFASDVESVTEDYRTWLSDSDARLRSGKSVSWLRNYFPEWERLGLAKFEGRERFYRALVVPQRRNIESARAAARRAALQASAH